MTTIHEITGRKGWNDFLLQLAPNTFLQSWEWGQVQKQDGHSVRYLGFFDGNNQIGAGLLITTRAKRGTFFLCPHGPLFKDEKSALANLPNFAEYVKTIAAQEKAAAFRIAPLVVAAPETEKAFAAQGFRPAPMHMHAELTWMLDIHKKDEEILSSMRKTTRHAVKKALATPELSVEVGKDPAAVAERFWPLYTHTGQRHDFVLYKKELIESQIKMLPQTFGVFVRHNNQDVAAAIVFVFGRTAFYYHGASLPMPSSLPASHLTQWSAIQEAKRLGCTRYNFWGIAPEKEPKHPFAGITVFKKGFGGYPINYLHAHDLPLSVGYYKLWLIDTYRKLRRGFGN